LKFGAVGSIRDAGNGITVFDTSGGYQHRNFTSGEYQFEQNANSGMFFYNRVAGIVISGSSTQIQDVDFIPFSASLDSRINTLSAETGSYITETESGSFLITASFASQTLTFTKGDNTTFSVTIPDVSGSTIDTASFATTGSNTFIGTEIISGSVTMAVTGSGDIDTLRLIPWISASAFNGGRDTTIIARDRQ
ncbi:MAG: hypothetical protein ACK55I_19160, partial [bacterium]